MADRKNISSDIISDNITKGKILVTGANGQVGRALKNVLGDNCVAIGREQIDLANPNSIQDIVVNYEPIAIINAAAYTTVDKAEEEERIAFVINGDAAGELALYSFRHGIPFIHYSTDYVFSGTGNHKMSENDVISPLNAYGRSKLDGEMKVQAASSKFPKAKWLIFRTSWVYDETGHNFLNTMIKLGKEKNTLSIVSDQIGAPTYAADLAKYTVLSLTKAMQKRTFPSGIYNLCNANETSWYGFAEEIFKIMEEKNIKIKTKKMNSIKTAQYPTPAKRPLNSRLDISKFENLFDIEIPCWKDALAHCIDNMNLEK